MPRYKLIIEYDGSDFAGWQVQPGKRTVQGELEAALAQVCGHPIRVFSAGRTDSGVHAAAMPVHFDTAADRELHQILLGANGALPPDAAIVAIELAAPDFDARRDAVMRHYQYRLVSRPGRMGYERQYVAHTRHALDEVRVREGLALLDGEHDFASFRSAACEAARTVLTLSTALRRDGDLWVFDFHARSFLYNMIRIIIGALTELGRGKIEIDAIRAMLDGAPRPACISTAPARGLTLMGVEYPQSFSE